MAKGERIDESKAQKGDLVVYQSPDKGNLIFGKIVSAFMGEVIIKESESEMPPYSIKRSLVRVLLRGVAKKKK